MGHAESGLPGESAGLLSSPSNWRPINVATMAYAMQAAAAKSGQSVEAMIDKRRAGIPAQRMGTADEFGAFCAFLCSAQAGYLTGQNILLDGGAYPGTF